MKLLIFLFLFFICCLSIANGNVGMVKRVKLKLPGEKLIPVKVSDKANALLRIISSKKVEGGFEYDFEFTGLEPRTYNLIKYLRTAATEEPVNFPEHIVKIDTVLAKDFQGELVDFQKDVAVLTPWYKNLNRLLIVVWVICLPLIILYGRKKKPVEEVVEKQEKSLPEKIHELIDSIETNSSKEIWQQIEGLIIQHWYELKDLKGLPMHEAIVLLKKDNKAGPFIIQLEKGLHSKEHKNEADLVTYLRQLTQEANT